MKSNPTRAGPSPFGKLHPNLCKPGYAASVGRQQPATEGPSEVSPGGVTFRLGWWAKLPSLWKPGNNPPSAVGTWLRRAAHQSDWWSRLDIKANDIDR